MRSPLVYLLLLLILGCQQPSEFEGRVIYQQRVISKHSSVDANVYNQIFGDTLTWTYRKGNYTEESNGSGSPKIIYLKDKAFTFTILTDSVVVRDVTHEEKHLDTLYFSGKKETILNHSCTELVKVINGVYHRFWVSSKLSVAPENFSAYQLSHYNSQYSFAPFHYLRYEYESGVFKIEREAILVDQSHVSPETFSVPGINLFDQ